jgi:hypothetical protein
MNPNSLVRAVRLWRIIRKSVTKDRESAFELWRTGAVLQVSLRLFTVVVAETTLVSSSRVCNYDLAFETINFAFYRLVKFDCFTHCLTMCQGLKYTFGDSGGKRVSFQQFKKKTAGIHLHISLSLCLALHISTSLSLCLPTYLLTYLPTYLSWGALISSVEATLATFALD